MAKKPNYEKLMEHTLNGLKEKEYGFSLSKDLEIDVTELPEGFEKKKADFDDRSYRDLNEEEFKQFKEGTIKNNSEYEYVPVSVSRLEEETGFSRYTINNTIKKMEQDGKLKKIKRKNRDGGNATNIYILNPNK